MVFTLQTAQFFLSPILDHFPIFIVQFSKDLEVVNIGSHVLFQVVKGVRTSITTEKLWILVLTFVEVNFKAQ